MTSLSDLHWLDKVIREQDDYYRKTYGIEPDQRRKLFDAAAEFTEEEEIATRSDKGQAA